MKSERTALDSRELCRPSFWMQHALGCKIPAAVVRDLGFVDLEAEMPEQAEGENYRTERLLLLGMAGPSLHRRYQIAAGA